MKVKVFNVGEDVMVFLHKERFLVAFPDATNTFNTLNVVDIHEYQADKALYQEENSGSSSSDVEETGVGRLVACIKEETAHRKGSTGFVQV
ncbi:hypothetical protein KIW84_021969 [Lathyrus oleraceus]|uniref:Uncharacterized protein n=1 Tax=Pisum sativum TaxID=3888 RepID=A0A9D4YC03_PEA|nr:hypothetical protein KIW84_021969 [Pisum sativum]